MSSPAALAASTCAAASRAGWSYATTCSRSNRPRNAAAWHRRYLVAVAKLAGGFNAQLQALLESDHPAYLKALDRTRDASDLERALTDEFNRRFAHEFGG